jgi:hypothetical protein
MARGQVAFRVQLELGEPRPGAWCDLCLLPRAVTWPLYGVYPGGVFSLGELVACPVHVDVQAVTRQACQRVAEQLHGRVVEG